MKKIAIIIIAYNRDESLKRLLGSITDAEYYNQEIDLIISIDKNNNELVYQAADDFKWQYGEKKVIKYECNLGLREHVLKCGDFALEYSNIVVLEDDLYISKGFFNFTKQAVNYFNEDNEVAGISLYSPNYNEICRRPFTPVKDNNDVYFIQYPSSWGQIWSSNQWRQFREWYNTSNYIDLSNDTSLPVNVSSWPKSSWKKIFTKYMVEKNKYFVYPYQSLSTNFGDEGTHFRSETSTFQAPISNFIRDYTYNFCDLRDSLVVYDVFMENVNLYNSLAKQFNEQVTVDLYGTKNEASYGRLVLTSKKLNYKIIKQYGLNLRPHEMNIFSDIEGTFFSIYDTSSAIINKSYDNDYSKITYDNYSLTRISVALKFILGRLKIYINYLGKKIIK